MQRAWMIAALFGAVLLAACGQVSPVAEEQQDPQDAGGVGALGFSTSRWDTANDAAGHAESNTFYVVGSSQGSVSPCTPACVVAERPFIVKYDPDKNILWRRQFGPGNNASFAGKATNLVVNSAGEAYVLGSTNSSLTGGLYSFTGQSIFLRKYSTGGASLWTRYLGEISDPSNSPADVALDPGGGVVVFGSNNAKDMLVYRVSGTGAVSSVYSHTREANFYWPISVSTDASSNIYLLTNTLGGSPPVWGSVYIHKLNSGGTYLGQGFTWESGQAGDMQVRGTDVFIAMSVYSSSSSVAGTWIRKFPTALTHYTTPTASVKIAESHADFRPRALKLVSGNLFVAGRVFGNLPGYSGASSVNPEAAVVSYSAALGLRWRRQFGSNAEEWVGGMATLNGQNALFLVGGTEGTLPGAAGNVGGRDAFVSRISTGTGNVIWTDQ